MKTFKNIIKQLINILFLIIIIYILGNILLQKESLMFKFDNFKLLFVTTIYTVCVVILYKLLSKLKQNRLIVGIILGIILVIQCIVSYLFCVKPSWDFGKVFNEATKFNVIIENTKYFTQCANNIPIMLIFKSIFYIFSFIGTNNYLILGIILNIIIIDSSIWVAYLLVKRILGRNKALFALVLFALNPAIYLYGPIFYTDTLTMIFPILILYLYVLLKDENISKKRKTVIAILFGIIMAVGIILKFTIVIPFIAIIIYEVFFDISKKNIKLKCIQLAKIIIAMIIVVLLQKILLVKIVPNYTEMKDKSLPFLHFIMMSIEGDGRFNQDDVDFTMSLDLENRNEKLIEEIKNRMQKHNENNDWYNFITNKMLTTWGDGTYYIPWQLEREPVHNGIHQEFIFRDGKYKSIYAYYTQAQHITMFILMIFLIFYKLERKDFNYNILKLTFIGLFLVFIIYEAKSRYIVNFMPIFVIMQVIGLGNLSALLNKKQKVEVDTPLLEHKNKQKREHSFL